MRRAAAVVLLALALAPAAGQACGADPSAAASVLDYWTRALRDGDPLRRVQAVRAIAETRDARAVPALTEALADADPGVRREAARALEAIRRPR